MLRIVTLSDWYANEWRRIRLTREWNQKMRRRFDRPYRMVEPHAFNAVRLAMRDLPRALVPYDVAREWWSDGVVTPPVLPHP